MPAEVSSEQAVAFRPVAGEWERHLVLAARRGDEEAFRELYRTFRDPVWGLIISLVGDSSQAQDVLQNVFFKAFRGLGGFRFRSGLFTWIYRIARNECLNHLRKRGVPPMPLEAIVGSRDEIDTRQASDHTDKRAVALRAAVMRLPLKMREVIVLRYIGDLSYKDVSRVLGCPAGTVASRLSRALAELEAQLRPYSGVIR
jgi:RNA polymerase sigma-70 factor (ECF subfamily)